MLDEQSVAFIEGSKWEAFMAMGNEQQLETIGLFLSPGIAAVLCTFFLIASLRNVFLLDDRSTFVTAMIVAAINGVMFTYFMADAINDAVGFVFYTNKALIAAVFLTPLANHFTYRLIIIILYSAFYIGHDLPHGHAFCWLGRPVSRLANTGYRALTGRRFVPTPGKEEH